jgi:23S rRNA (adenine2503-C2)-methyltransferase
MKTNLLDLDPQQFAAFVSGLGEKPYRGRQLKRWIHHTGAGGFEAMTDMAKVFRDKLAAEAEIALSLIHI